MEELVKRMETTGVIPVVTVDSPQQGQKVMETLKRAGLLAAEVTFRTDAGEKALKLMRETAPEALIGAGTVLTIEQVDAAMEARADYISSTGSTVSIMEYCLKNNIHIIPGCMTPSEIQLALSMEINVVKFFPAEALGGLNILRAISAPYPNMRFIPTGGISLTNANEYLRFPKVVCCGGSWIAQPSKKGNYAAVERAARDVTAMVDEVKREKAYCLTK